jgi:mRNA interferase RelE/StbE
MQIEFLSSFYKDLDKLENKKVAFRLLEIISLIESADSLENIPNLKKLKGHPQAFRIRIQNYRVGLFLEGSIVEFARILPRKDIYKYFPK